MGTLDGRIAHGGLLYESHSTGSRLAFALR